MLSLSKKLFILLLITSCMGCFTAFAGLFESNVNQNSRDAALASLVRAVITEDSVAIYKLTAPESRKEIIKQAGNIFSAYRKLNELIKPARQETLDYVKSKFGDAVNGREFIISIIDEDVEDLWDAYNSNAQKKLIAAYGSKDAACKQLKGLMPFYKRALLLEAKRKIGKDMICIDNKWFFVYKEPAVTNKSGGK